MTKIQLDQIITNIKHISQALGNDSIYCQLIQYNKQSSALENRKTLRRLLVNQLKLHYKTNSHNESISENQWNDLLVLKQRPQSSIATISLSHCSTLGGFIFSFNNSINIGFDIETTHRINEQVIKRISTAKEIQQTPSHDFLWTAKEAALKACTGLLQKPTGLSQYLISNWTTINNYFLFSFETTEQHLIGKGGAFQLHDTSFSYAQIKQN